MPNWCNNSLKVEGKASELKIFVKKAKGVDTDLSLQKLYPMPKALRDTTSPVSNKTKAEQEKNAELLKKYGFADWWTWRISKWGTKWDIEAHLQKIGKTLYYGFDSAWAPPVNWLEYVCKKFPKLTFTLDYEESGVGFRGQMICENGEVVSEEEYDWTGAYCDDCEEAIIDDEDLVEADDCYYHKECYKKIKAKAKKKGAKK